MSKRYKVFDNTSGILGSAATVTSLLVSDLTAATSSTTGAAIVAGGVYVGGNINTCSTISGNFNITTSGGMGISGDINTNVLSVSSTTEATSATTGSIQTTGGISSTTNIKSGTSLYYNGITRFTQLDALTLDVQTVVLSGTAGSDFTMNGAGSSYFIQYTDHVAGVHDYAFIRISQGWSSKGTATGDIKAGAYTSFTTWPSAPNYLEITVATGITWTGTLSVEMQTDGTLFFWDNALAGGARTRLTDANFAGTGTLVVQGVLLKNIL